MQIVKLLKTAGSAIDRLNEWAGRIACWLVIPLTFLVSMDVVLRYVFNKPTIWAWDVNVQLLCVLGVMGGGYNLLFDAHIGIDVLTEKLSVRKRKLLSVITYLFFFFSVGILLWKTTSAAWVAVETQERSASYFMPPIYPLKIVMFLGVLFLLLQGIRKFVTDLIALISSKEGGES